MRKVAILSIIIVAIFGTVAVPAQACFISISNEVIVPEGMTDPDEIARYQARLERQREAESANRSRREWRNFMRRLDEEADRGAQRNSAQLASDLAVSFVPPLFEQLAMYSSCGTIDGPDMLDPAGYADSPIWSGNSLLANYLLAHRFIASVDDIGSLDRRRIRDLEPFDRDCQQEVLHHTSRRLSEDFRHAELVHVWTRLHRLGFNLAADDFARRSAGQGPRPYRLLSFSEGRSGPLMVSGYARVTGSSQYPARQIFSVTQQMHRFMASDGVAQRMIAAVAETLSGNADDRCPEVMQAIAVTAEELAATAPNRQ